MNTIGEAIDLGKIHVNSITWEACNDIYVSPCQDCKYEWMNEHGYMACKLFTPPYDSIEACQSVETSTSSLMCVISECAFKQKVVRAK